MGVIIIIFIVILIIEISAVLDDNKLDKHYKECNNELHSIGCKIEKLIDIMQNNLIHSNNMKQKFCTMDMQEQDENISDTDRIYQLTHDLVICRCEKVDYMLKVSKLERELEKIKENKIDNN